MLAMIEKNEEETFLKILFTKERKYVD